MPESYTQDPLAADEFAPATRKFTNIPERMAEGGYEYVPNEPGASQESELALAAGPSEQSQLADLAVIGPKGIESSGLTSLQMPEDPKLAGLRAQAEKEFGAKRANELFNESLKGMDNPASNPMNRRRDFEQQLFKQIGGNPFEVDPVAEVRKADKDLPRLFEEVFRGQATWSDLPNLSKEQRAYWQQVVNEYHAHVKESAVSKQQSMYRQYKYGMEQFDWEDKKLTKQEDQVRAQTLEMIKQSGKIPKFQTMLNDKGLWTVHGYDQKTGQWNDTGKVGKKSDAMKSVTIDQALAVLRYIAPTGSENPMNMVGALLGASGIEDKKARAEAMQKAMSQQERKIDPANRGIYRYYMSVLFAHAGLGMDDEPASSSAIPKTAPQRPAGPATFIMGKDGKLKPTPQTAP